MIEWGTDGAYIPKCTFTWTEAEKMTPQSLKEADGMDAERRAKSGKITTEELRAMKEVCYECPIRKGCAQHAIATRPEGLYAGIVLLPFVARAMVARGDGSMYTSTSTRARDTALRRLKNLVDFLSEKQRIAS